jgi:hypothetical protein
MVALEEHDVFAVDLEGVELGRGGTIAILQVTRLTFILPIMFAMFHKYTR